MACKTCLCEWLLGTINVILMLVGLAIAAIGAVLQQAAGSTFLAFLETSIKSVLEGVKVLGTNSVMADINFQKTFGSLAIVLIIIGLIIACLAFLGWCSNCCGGYNIIRILYTIVLCIVIVIQIVVVAVFFSKALDSRIQTEITTLINTDYGDLDNTNLTSIAANLIMLSYNCCGLNNYTDFNTAASWVRTRSLKINGVDTVVTQQTPLACCVTTGTFPSVSFVDDYCAVTPTDTISNWKKGCWNAVTTDLDQYRAAAILICCAIIVVQAILVLIVVLIIKANQKNKVDPA